MKDTVGEGIQVKAAGGIRSWETAAKMIDAGATRLGTSSAFIILEGFNNR
jgi:deoxyribose-phosphate aldolase